MLEKTAASTGVLAPGYSLVNWGGDLTHFFPERFFLGLDQADSTVFAVPLVVIGLVIALRRAPRDIRWGLGAVVAVGVLAALFFRPREYGWYFHFKALAFVAPLVVTAAAVGLAKLNTSYPHVPVGPPLMTLDRYQLFKLKPDLDPVHGDRCSRKMVLTVKKLYAGGKNVEP